MFGMKVHCNFINVNVLYKSNNLCVTIIVVAAVLVPVENNIKIMS